MQFPNFSFQQILFLWAPDLRVHQPHWHSELDVLKASQASVLNLILPQSPCQWPAPTLTSFHRTDARFPCSVPPLLTTATSPKSNLLSRAIIFPAKHQISFENVYFHLQLPRCSQSPPRASSKTPSPRSLGTWSTAHGGLPVPGFSELRPLMVAIPQTQRSLGSSLRNSSSMAWYWT